MAATETLAPQYESGLTEWDKDIKHAAEKVWDIANQYTKAGYDRTSTEHYFKVPIGAYRVYKGHIEVEDKWCEQIKIEHYPESLDEPIAKLTMEIKNSFMNLENTGFTLQFDYGVAADERFKTYKCDKDTLDSGDLKECIEFIDQAQLDLSKVASKDKKQVDLTNINGVVDLDPSVSKDPFALDEITDEKVRIDTEREIARAALEELNDMDVEFEGHAGVHKRGLSWQYERILNAAKQVDEENRHRMKVERPNYVSGAGMPRTNTAASIVKKGLRMQLGHESKIPKEGITHLPEKHLLVCISDFGINAAGYIKTPAKNTVVAVADDTTQFEEPLHFINSQVGDPEATDVTFDTKAINAFVPASAAHIEAKKGHIIDIHRMLLIGPGDTVEVTKQNKEKSDKYSVGNIDGRLFIDGIEVSPIENKILRRRVHKLKFSRGDVNYKSLVRPKA